MDAYGAGGNKRGVTDRVGRAVTRPRLKAHSSPLHSRGEQKGVINITNAVPTIGTALSLSEHLRVSQGVLTLQYKRPRGAILRLCLVA